MSKINYLFLYLFFLSSLALAQSDEFIEKVTVTGSLIKSEKIELVNPIFSISKDDLDKVGTFRIEDYLFKLPQITPSNSALQSQFSSGTASISLRSLGSERTLVLVDGKRLPLGTPFNGHSEADLNQIPDVLIKRIDVVTGGKSTIYGSDAIGGVVNFILDRNFEGLKLDLQGGYYDHKNNNQNLRSIHLAKPYPLAPESVTDGDQKNISIIYGRSLFEDSHFTAYLNYRKVDSIRWSERDISNCALSANAACRGSSASKEGKFKIDANTIYHVDGTSFSPGSTTYNFASYNFLQRPDNKLNTGFLFDHKINENHSLKTSFFHTQDKTIAQVDYSLLFNQSVSIPCSNPFLSSQQLEKLCTDFGKTLSDSQSVILSRRNFEGLPRQQDFDLTSNRFVIEFEGKITDNWQYNFFHQRSITDLEYVYFNDISKTRTKNALNIAGTIDNAYCVDNDSGCVPWNIFINNGNQVVSSPSQGVTQEALDYINLNLSIFGSSNESNQVLYLSRELNFENELFLPSSIAIGFEKRKTSLNKEPDSNFLGNDGAGQIVDQRRLVGTTEIDDFFIEFFAPLKNSIKLSSSYRHSDYSSKDTDTFDLGITYSINNQITLKGAVQKAVRTPGIHELFEETHAKYVALSSDPCSGTNPEKTLDVCTRTGVTSSLYGSIEAPASSIATLVGGNSSLNPESAITSSIGLIFETQRDFLEIDFYFIDLDDQIDTSDAETILVKCLETGLSKWCSLISRDPVTGTFHEGSGKISTPLLNFVSNETSGLDIFYKRSWFTSFGSIQISNFSNFLTKREIHRASSEIPFDCRGKYENICGAPSPKFQNILTIDINSEWLNNPVSSTFKVRHLGSVDDINFDNSKTSYDENVPFKSFTYLDTAVNISFKYIDFRFGINNLFDIDPPVNGQIGYVPGNGNFYPSFYDSLGRFIFLRLSTEI